MKRKLATLLFGLVAMTSTRGARADERQACDAAYDQAQILRDAKRLLSARDQLRVCARPVCAASVVKDCAGWLNDLEARLPSVVLAATDAAGAALPNVTVSIDGAAPRAVDGTSWDVDPGQHTFTFVLSDGTKLDMASLVLEGQKSQRVVATSGPAPTHAPTPAPPAAPAQGSSLKLAGYVVGGAGVAGLAVGTIFGVAAFVTKGQDCKNDVCVNGGESKAKGEGDVSTIGFVAGGVLVAAGVSMVVLAPKPTERTARLEVLPFVAGATSGLLLRGSF